MEQYDTPKIVKLFKMEPALEDGSIVFKLRLLKDKIVEAFDVVRKLKKYRAVNEPSHKVH